MQIRFFKATALAVGLCLASVGHATTAPPTTYALKELGNQQNQQTPLHINNVGEIIGVVTSPSCCLYTGAIFWTASGELKALSTIAPRTLYSLNGFSNNGVILGSYQYNGSDDPAPAPVWKPENLPSGEYLVTNIKDAAAVNDIGQVATPTGLYTVNGELLTNFGTLGGVLNIPRALNSGQSVAAGSYQLAGGAGTHAAVWSGPSMRDLGTLGGTNSDAYDLNDNGVIVGDAQITDNTARHAVRWDGYNGTPVDLGTLGGQNSSARAINKAGVIVGQSQDAAGVQRATMWVGNQVIDLNTLLVPGSLPAGTVLDSARDINDAGQILVKIPSGGLNMTEAGGFLMTVYVPPVVTCNVSYAVNTSNLIGFTAQVTVNNMSNAPLTGWNVGWTYSTAPFVIASNNAKIKVSGTSVKATPTTANQTIPATGSTTFTFTSLKGKLVPTVSGFTADLGGKGCTTNVN